MAISYASSTITLTYGYDYGTATGGSATTLVDSGKSWGANVLVGRLVWIKAGTRQHAVGYCTSHTSTTITCSGGFYRFNPTSKAVEAVTIASGDTYAVCYNMADIISAQPSYASWTLNNRIATITGAGLSLTTSGALQCIDEQWTFATDKKFISSATGTFFQTGLMASATYPMDGQRGGIISSRLASVGYQYFYLLGKAKFYASDIGFTREIPTDENAFIGINLGANTAEGVELYGSTLRHCSIYLSSEKDIIYNSKTVGMNTSFGGDSSMGVDGQPLFFKNNRSQMGLRAYFGDEDGTRGADILDHTSISSDTYDHFLFQFTIAQKGVAYLWNHSPTNAWTSAFRWYGDQGDGHVYRGYLVGLEVKDASGNAVSGAQVYVAKSSDGAGAILTGKNANYTPITASVVSTDANGKYIGVVGAGEGLPVLYARYTRYSQYVSTETLYGQYDFKIGQHGFFAQAYSRNWTERSKEGITFTANPYITCTKAEALAHPFTYSGGVFTLTADITSDAIRKLYEFAQDNWIFTRGFAGNEPFITTDGINYTFASGFSLNTAGYKLIDTARKIADVSSDVTVATGGFYEDTEGAIKNISGALYYAKHVYRNVKALTGGANQQYAVCACIDDGGNDRTYNTSFTLGGLTTDASGNAEGYYVYKIDSTAYTISEYILAYGFDPYVVPLSANGTPIGSSASYDTARLVTDAQVTLSRSSALAISGITVSHSTSAIDLSDETFSVASDNLKARQASTSDIETGIKGYLSYVADGRYIAKADNLYTGKSGWTYANSVAGGTFKTGILVLDTAGTYDIAVETCTIRFSATGSYNLADTTFAGTIDFNNASGGAVTAEVPAGVTYTRSGSPLPTIIEPQVYQSVTVSGAVAGSLLQIYDTANSEQLYIGNPTFPYTWTDASPYASDRTIRVRVAYVDGDTAKQFIDENWGTLTEASPSISRSVTQEDDEVYNTNAIDGSTVTGVAIDDEHLLVNVSVGEITLAELYAYETYWLFTEDGIIDEGRYTVAVDTANYKFYNFKIKNISSPSVPLTITGGWAVDGDTGVAIDLLDTSGGTIFMAGDHVVPKIVTVAGASVITGDIADIPTASENAQAVLDAGVLTTDDFLALK